jgi:hypothetical protein
VAAAADQAEQSVSIARVLPSAADFSRSLAA